MSLPERKLRVVVFGNTPRSLDPLVKGLGIFTNTKKIIFSCRPISSKNTLIWFLAFHRLFEILYWSLKIFKNMREFKADIILTQFAFYWAIIGVIAAKLSRKPCVVQAIGSDLRVLPQSRLGKIIVLLVLRLNSGVICVSKDLQMIAKKLGAKKIIVIPPPLDLQSYKEINLKKNEREIISVAKLTPIKGIEFLIRSMRYIDNCKLIIIGDGPEEDKLVSLSMKLGLNKRISFLGWHNHNQKFWEILQKAQVFVLPSLSEGIPKSILEAMACGLPIVATKVGGIPEIIHDNVNGILVPPKDEKSLAKAIEKVLNDSSLQKRAFKTNKKNVKRYFLPFVGQEIYKHLKTYVVNFA